MSLTSSSSSSGNNGSGGNRVSRRLTGQGVEDDEKERPSKSLRRMRYCTEFPLPRNLMCSGCVAYEESSISSKSKGDREVTHSSDRYICTHPWKKPPTDATNFYDDKNVWYSKIQAYLESKHINVSRIHHHDSPNTPATKQAIVAVGVDDEESQISDLTTTPKTTDRRTVKKDKNKIQKSSWSVNSTGHSFTIKNVPATHSVIRNNELERLRNSEKLLKDLQSGFHKKKKFNGASDLSRSLMGIAGSS